MSLVADIHEKHVFGRRISRLCELLGGLIPEGSRVLDVGCGDGRLSRLLMDLGKGIQIEGIDVLLRPETHIPVREFDGTTIPHEEGSFDLVMFVDVLHHTEDPMVLLKEADRVARKGVVIKDHLRDGFLAGPTLRFMDWVGNARHGVALPYNYWSSERWSEAFDELHWQKVEWIDRLSLYPPPASWFFDRGLHYVARFGREGES